MPEYLLPDVGEGLTEAEIVSWKVKVGDVIAINDVVVEIETAKSLVELPSPYAGTVTGLLVAEGETVAVGTPIIAIGDEAIDLSNPAASGGGEGESLVGRVKAEGGSLRRARRKPITEAAGEYTARADVHDTYNQNATKQHEAVEHLVSAVVTDAEQQGGSTRRSRPAPPAPEAPARPRPAPRCWPSRRCASWPRTSASTSARVVAHWSGWRRHPGRCRGCVVAVVGACRDAARRSSTQLDHRRGRRREPIKGVRKMMAGAMVQSAFTAPHVTEWVTFDATGTMEFVERLKKRREFKDVKVSPLLVLSRAVMLAMRRTPEINSYWDEAAQEVVFKHYVNLGIAAATPRGLVVPNVKDAQDLSLARARRCAQPAHRDRSRRQDAAGGDERWHVHDHQRRGLRRRRRHADHQPGRVRDPVLRRDQEAAVGRDAIEEIVVRHVTTLALAFDHRHIDGEKGSQFLADVAAIVEDPAAALLFWSPLGLWRLGWSEPPPSG